MRRMRRFCVVLLLLVLTSGPVWTQESEIITVTGLYRDSGHGVEGDNTLVPCHVFEGWLVPTDSPTFPALLEADSPQMSQSDSLFVEVRGRYTASEHEQEEACGNDGRFEITELVRYSTAAADIAACEWTCERAYGADSSTCLARVNGQCGSTRNSCVTGDLFDHDEAHLADTATHYRWECVGSYGGDSVTCTAPKAGLRETEADEPE